MVAPLDIFKLEKDGSLVWKAAAESLDVAKLSVKTLAASAPGDYVIFNQTTGFKTVVRPDGSTKHF